MQPLQKSGPDDHAAGALPPPPTYLQLRPNVIYHRRAFQSTVLTGIKRKERKWQFSSGFNSELSFICFAHFDLYN